VCPWSGFSERLCVRRSSFSWQPDHDSHRQPNRIGIRAFFGNATEAIFQVAFDHFLDHREKLPKGSPAVIRPMRQRPKQSSFFSELHDVVSPDQTL
jgi:hypothetical protein